MEMLEEDTLMFTNSGSYLESLIRSRQHLKGSALAVRLDEIIYMELELAYIGAEKALNELKPKKDNVTLIKGDKK